MRIRFVTLLLATIVAAPHLLFAQTATTQPKPAAPSTEPEDTWTDRIRISVNGGGQVTNSSASQSGTFQHFEEPGTLQVDYKLHAVPQVDGGIILRVWKNVGVGVAVSFFSDNTGASIDAQVPHPFFPGRLRNTSGGGTLHRQETGVHIHLTYRVPLSRTFDVILSGGPSAINVGQDVVDSVAVNEALPFDTVTFDHAITRRVAKTSVGFNAGADFAWTFSRHAGLGALFRYSRATAKLEASSSNSVSVDLGGLHAGLGFRLRF